MPKAKTTTPAGILSRIQSVVLVQDTHDRAVFHLSVTPPTQRDTDGYAIQGVPVRIATVQADLNDPETRALLGLPSRYRPAPDRDCPPIAALASAIKDGLVRAILNSRPRKAT
jgi:hypothetical protein